MDNNSTLQSNDDVTINDIEEEITHDFIVSTLEDENDGDFSAGDLSLREAIALANQQEGADTITFDESLSGGTISFDSSLERDLNIEESVSILGLGQDNLTLDGGFIFNIAEADNEVTVDGLNLIGGTIDNSGNLTFSNSTISETLNIEASSDYYAIISRGNANIIDSTIKDNNGGSNVGIVIEAGTATIERSAITGNDSTAYAQSGVIIYPETTVDIINSTIANNRARSNGGIENAGTVNITNSTIFNNTGGLSAGGINNFESGTVTLTSSLLANNRGSANIGDISGEGVFISGGNNLISNGDDAEGFVDGVNGDIVGSNGDDPGNPQNDLLIDPQLGELQNNGGSTETIALLDGSPAIDAGSNPDNLETDQRGAGFDRTVGNGTDIGAYEVQADGGNEELVVSTLDDENDGDFSQGDLSLREAIALANQQEGADTITVDSSLSGGTISINESLERDLTINDSVAIEGLGQDNLTLDGGFIFSVPESDIDLAIDGLNLTGGKIDSSGNLTFSNSSISNTIGVEGNSADNSAIISRGTAYISDSTIQDNSSGNTAGNTGVFIESGTATIERSTIADNQAQSISGIIIGSEATVDLINSTVTGSRSRSIGGIQNDGTLNIINSTVSDNGGGEVGGINNNGIVTTTSSIIAGNNNENNFTDIVGGGEFVSNGNNLIGNGDNANGFVDSDLVGTANDPLAPRLGELQNNGGITPTIALLEDSPAIDAGSNPNNLETDQRGAGFDRTIGNATDIGAYEVQETGGEIPDELIVSTLEDENDSDFSAGDLSLREAIALANQQEGADTITFESGLNGSIILSQGELLVEDSVIINGLGAENTIIDGNNSSRVFRIDDGNSETDIDVTLDGVSVTNGFVAEETTYSLGGGILNQENLTIVGSIVTNNSAEDPTGAFTSRGGGIYTTGNTQINDSIITGNNGIFGGGIYSLSATVTITDSIVSNNYAGFVGGGLYNDDTELNLNSSIITGNEAGFAYGGIGLKDSTGNITYTY